MSCEAQVPPRASRCSTCAAARLPFSEECTNAPRGQSRTIRPATAAFHGVTLPVAPPQCEKHLDADQTQLFSYPNAYVRSISDTCTPIGQHTVLANGPRAGASLRFRARQVSARIVDRYAASASVSVHGCDPDPATPDLVRRRGAPEVVTLSLAQALRALYCRYPTRVAAAVDCVLDIPFAAGRLLVPPLARNPRCSTSCASLREYLAVPPFCEAPVRAPRMSDAVLAVPS